MADFDETPLPRNISMGAQGGPGWNTIVIVSASGHEQRIGAWSRAREKWTVGHNLRNMAELHQLKAFFQARRGRLRGFRFQDPLDHSSKLGGVETKHDTLSITATTFQLQKSYPDDFDPYTRPITKPVSDSLGDPAATQANSTVRVYNGATEITSGWTVDCSLGVLTFLSAPGYLPSATFEYDLPARFDDDQMVIDMAQAAYGNWPTIAIMELREAGLGSPDSPPPVPTGGPSLRFDLPGNSQYMPLGF